MPDPQFETGLRELASDAGLAATPPPAAAIRRRAHTRTVRRRTITGAVTVLLIAGAGLGTQLLPSKPTHHNQPAASPTVTADPSPTPTPGRSATPTTPQTGAGVPQGQGEGQSTPTRSSVVPGCRRADLTVTMIEMPPNDTHRGVILVFTNSSGSACHTVAYPGVDLRNANGAVLASARRSTSGSLGGLADGTKAAKIVLQPGDSASAILEAVTGQCQAFAGMNVTAPDETVSSQLTWTTDACADPQIHPLVPGITGDN